MENSRKTIEEIALENTQLIHRIKELEEALQKNQADLDTRVRERTIALEKANSALQESEARFRGLSESSPALIFVVQGNKMRYVNPMFVMQTEYNEEECMRMNFWDFIHPDFRSIIKERGLARQKGKIGPNAYETKLLTKHGREVWVTMYANDIIFEGQPAIVGSLYDISERKKFEEALAQSEVLYRAIFETTGTAMMIFDQDMLISLVNTEFEELSGYTKEEIQHKIKWPYFVAPDDRKRMKEYHFLRRTIAQLAPSHYEFKLVDKQGNIKEIFITVDIIPGTTDSVVSFMDITERKKAEAQIKYLSFNDKLTGLYNRAFFEEELTRLNTQRQLPISLIIGDVNGLKLINDALGHEKGDMLLRKVADILKQSCRREDIVARWGGDEFIILLPTTIPSNAWKIYGRIKNSCQNSSDFPIPISISLGLATKYKEDQDMQEIIKEAEDKMYRNKLLESKSARSSFVTSLERTLWEKSHETEEHCQRLRQMAEQIGKQINLPAGDLDDLKLLAALHDVGKIAIPDDILNKAGSLSSDEWEIIKKHPETGYRIALTLPELAPIAEAILTHHEHWDGSGYPLGLNGSEIPLLSRILSIADAYDAMIQGRPYKKAISAADAQAEINRCAGSQFDPDLVIIFNSLLHVF